MNSKILLLGFFLLPVVFVTGSELTINNYIVKINGNILENVEPTGELSDELDLSGLGLENIDENAFRNATNLTKLNLSNNSLTIFPSERLESLVNLKNLSVANNQIWRMPQEFIGLDNLQIVDLSNNPLEFLWGIGVYGRGRTNFIVKGSPIYGISFANNFYKQHNQLEIPTQKPLIPVFTSIHSICSVFGNEPDFYVQADANNENTKLADEKIKCPKLIDPDWVYSNNTLSEDLILEVCIENGTLNSLTLESPIISGTKNCKRILAYHGESILRLEKMGIENFSKNWYQIETIEFYTVDLSHNKITKLSNNLLNDLPESVKHVRLSGNDIKSIDAGIIDNKFLTLLDLSDNKIHDIQSNAFDKTNLSGLILSRNNFSDTQFLQVLPSNITELYLTGNRIFDIPANSFARFDKLIYLDVAFNFFTILRNETLRGLTSLQQLILTNNILSEIEDGAFQDLRELRNLQLDRNRMREMKKSVFGDLKELIFLNFDNNFVEKITKETNGLPDNLRVLQLVNNRLENLEKNSFVKVPKYVLDLDMNFISKIDRDDIDIPSLVSFTLRRNNLSIVKKDYFHFPDLRKLALAGNPIGNIEKGAFGYLRYLKSLDISFFPISTLLNGTLSGIRLDCDVSTAETHLEFIEGGAFFD